MKKPTHIYVQPLNQPHKRECISVYHPASLHLPKTAKRAAKEHGIRMISGERIVIDGHPAWLLMVPDIGSMYTKKMAAQIEAMFAEEDAF